MKIWNQKMHDALLLVIEQHHTKIEEYQQRLYDAAVCGVEYVMFYHNSYENDDQQISHIISSLNETVETLHMKSLGHLSGMLLPRSDHSWIFHIDQHHRVMSSIFKGPSFSDYRNKHSKVLKKSNKQKRGKI